MIVYWQESRKGQRLILSVEEGEGEQVEEIGGVRETKRGFDAFAKTFGYEPGRAQKGLPTLDDAKAFVESFTPWDLYTGTESITVDAELRPASG